MVTRLKINVRVLMNLLQLHSKDVCTRVFMLILYEHSKSLSQLGNYYEIEF